MFDTVNDKQTTDGLKMMATFRQRIDTHIDRTIHEVYNYQLSNISQSLSIIQAFLPYPPLTKKVYFLLNSSNERFSSMCELITMVGSNFLDGCKKSRGGYSIYPRMGRCGAAPHTLNLFKTKIADFPILFKAEFRFLDI